MLRMLLLAALVAVAVPAGAAQTWRVRYFYDTDKSSFSITDLEFPSPQRGMAAGFVVEGRSQKPTALVTSDGGRTWTSERLPAPPVSLFFLNDSLGWMVAPKGIYRTTEFGRNWKKVGSPSGAVQVWFTDDKQGWAVGNRKSVYETHDGGEHWKKLEAAAEPKSNPEYTTYAAVAFASPKVGMIAGWSRPPRRDDRQQLPDWMDPEYRRREWPSLLIVLQTKDGGQHWQSSETSAFGEVTQLRLAPDGRGLALLEFFNAFDWPAEVFKIDWHTGNTSRAFREKNRAVTDVALPAAGPAYLAAVEFAGALARTPVPGKLKLLKSEDLSNWTEMPVDYRATARRAMLAAPDAQNVWVATDTGMILKLE